MRTSPGRDVVRLEDSGTGDAAADLDLGLRLMQLVGSASAGPLLRPYSPLPTAAFSRRETHLPGFDRAVSAAAAAGYTPVVRPTGGRVVVYDGSSLVLDLAEPAEPHSGHRDAFERVSGAIAEALRDLGVNAAVGPVPGEYCPGEFSVGARGTVKLVGIAQRASRGARLVSAVVSLRRSDPAVALMTELNAELGLDWNPATCGSVDEEAGAASASTVERRLCEAIAPHAAAIDWHRFARPTRIGAAPTG